ncbi:MULTISPECIES: low molecular weight protein-tyrosine-phosphatase [unclassified Corynebacterium]|uniref:low molecular weight protein-tyrosine-phosphatase n=1 Tax=unclassified Corynebacterium TaxID=2624378 RepID=UPI002168B221|nr:MULTISPECIES: low molecular weight protein-tyrosine-phosphatase [unclassified Corynebacterium]MCS4490610.1 low molecular weight phosphotyrosine protein phosphatase [Corynebacterium sp. ES2775-CONJ]MCS4532419.1 low molecular weight phosphotyrosine protein phosphatase [Corynebacterium sp. ES2730-CONJ]
MSYHITVLCTGNICRSPMGDVILNDAITTANFKDLVRVDSCGTGGWHIGQGADKRAVAELNKAGYDGSQHRAQQFGEDFENADLIIAMDQSHVDFLKNYGVNPSRVRLLRSFDPDADSLEVEDPYYGYPSDFEVARVQIERAVPGILNFLRHELDLDE